MDLFETLEELKPFVFRITDNGGATADRYTVVLCDGSYNAMSSRPFHPQGVGMSGEDLDPGGIDERIERGVERDIRWIDLPDDCQRCVVDGLNGGYSDWLSTFAPPSDRSSAVENGTAVHLSERVGEGVYGAPGYYRVKRESEDADDDLGPYPTIREAVLATLPEEHDLSGPEHHAPNDLWDVTDGRRPPWDADALKDAA